MDPDLTATFDLDESSSDEDEEDAAFQQAEEEGELKQRKGKGRRMWGKKFKVRGHDLVDAEVDGNHNFLMCEE